MVSVRTILFSAVMLIYFCFPFSLIFNQEKILSQGELFQFRSIPVDPYDAFRGRYVALSSTISGAWEPDSMLIRGETAYVTFKKDSLGYAIVKEVLTSPPNHPSYLNLRISRINGNRISFNPPENMQRYYMNEKLAPKAEKVYRQLNRSSNVNRKANAHLDVKIWKGSCLIEELYLNDLPVTEYLEKLERENKEN